LADTTSHDVVGDEIVGRPAGQELRPPARVAWGFSQGPALDPDLGDLVPVLVHHGERRLPITAHQHEFHRSRTLVLLAASLCLNLLAVSLRFGLSLTQPFRIDSGNDDLVKDPAEGAGDGGSDS
jgi:hypothetical protein